MTVILDPGLLDNPGQHVCVLAEEIGHILYRQGKSDTLHDLIYIIHNFEA